MDIEFQHPKDLRLGVSQTQEIQPLTVLAEKTVVIEELSITFRIIGESHWITISHNENILLQEILACVSLQGEHWQHQHSFIDSRSHTFAKDGYEIQLVFAEMTPRISQMGNLNSIEVYFPNPLGNGEEPFTRIWWEYDGHTLQWWTIHVYPLEDGTVAVLSTSKFKEVLIPLQLNSFQPTFQSN